MADFYRDSNGASLKWGAEKAPQSALGHFSVIKIESITEIDDGLFALANCPCCPPIAFDERYSLKEIRYLAETGLNPSVPDAPNWCISDFKKRLGETEPS